MSGITKEQIYGAADSLAAQGIMPSNDKVRLALGNTGSEATIQKYLKEWKHDLLIGKGAGCVFCANAQQEVEDMKQVLQGVRETLMDLKENATKEKNYAAALSL